MKANGTPAPKPEERPGITIVISRKSRKEELRPGHRPPDGGLGGAVTRMVRGMRGLHLEPAIT